MVRGDRHRRWGNRTPGPDDQYLVASNTKTFTAVMVMQLRDEGRLSLDDVLGDHLSDVPHAVTVRQALAHVSGMQREPLGDIWDTLDQPDAVPLMRGFAEAERVGRPHTQWHYSNLAYAVLGQVVEKLEGRPWFGVPGGPVAAPLGDVAHHGGLRRRDHVTGYFVAALPRRPPARAGPRHEGHGGRRRPGEHRSRPGPLVGVRGRAGPEILSPDTLEEMCQPQVLLTPTAGPARWASASSCTGPSRAGRGSATAADCPVT